ncbi:11997_t:CDS:2 [Dentiscutata heterogama]|uniref:11997_t:CDS:1 n=1 Tax=Dentiscutata heterogama TaxID=1316150 RepID=A0ACA9L0J2_9GLOM|nr:11997_t:CDS:2 [Dentiscutata heterogama]
MFFRVDQQDYGCANTNLKNAKKNMRIYVLRMNKCWPTEKWLSANPVLTSVH